MTALTATVSALSDVLGWTLIHFVWQGAALAVLLALTRIVLPHRLARARYAAGCSTLALMLAVPALTAWHLADPAEPASPLIAGIDRTASTAASLGATALPEAERAGAALQRPAGAPATTTPRVDPDRLLLWIVGGWMLGVLFCSVRLLGGWWQARRLVSVGTRPAPAHWQRVTAALASRLRLTRSVRLLESSLVHVPLVIGWMRPALLVPTAVLAGLTPQQLEAVLAHELAHVRRHDYLVNLLQSVAETLLFYHPAIWWVSGTIRAEREHCCDDLAVMACGDRVLYARALTAIETLRHQEGSLAVAVTGSPLVGRIRRLLGADSPSRVSSSGWAIAFLTAAMVSGAGATSWLRSVLPAELRLAAPETEVARAETAQALPVPGGNPAPESAGDERPVPVQNTATDTSGDFSEAIALQQAQLETAREAMRQAGASVREALDRQHSTAVAEVRKAASRELGAARDAIREAEASLREALHRQRSAGATTRAAARSAARAAAKQESALAHELRHLEREAAAISREAARQAREMLREMHRALREVERTILQSRRQALEPFRGDHWEAPVAAPAPPAPPGPPAPLEPPAPDAEPPDAAVPPEMTDLPKGSADEQPPLPPAPPVPPQAPSDSRDSTWSMTQSTNGVTLRLRAKGRVEFTDDDADVRSLSPRGRFTVERSTGRFFGESQRFEVRAAGDGTLSRTYTKNGSTLDPAEGRKWLATFLPGLLRDMGVNANKRVARHLSQGGPAAVLDLVDRITTSQGKGAHLRELYRQATLDPAALARSLEGAARGIESDFEMAQVLTAAAERQPVGAAMQEWVRAAGTIGSDFEQRRVVSAALARPGLTPAEAAAILGAATPGAGRDGIRSDFELAEVLIGAPPGVIASAPDAWFDAIGTIQSAFERRRALTAAVARESAQLTPRVLEAAQGIGSDFERAELLVTVLRSGNVAESAMPQLAAAVRGVRSDFERARVLKAAAQASSTDAGLAQLIVTAGEIRSDFESAEALIALARSPAVGPEARKALAAAAERIGSRHERGRVLSELVRVGVLTASE